MSKLNDKSGNGELGTYTQWAEAFSKKDLERALRDQALIRHAQLKDGNDYTRTTPSGLTQRAYDVVRAERDDLDYREWNSDTGFSGVNRWPKGPGMVGQGPVRQVRGAQTEAEIRRRARRDQLDDGF